MHCDQISFGFDAKMEVQQPSQLQESIIPTKCELVDDCKVVIVEKRDVKKVFTILKLTNGKRKRNNHE